MICLKSMPEYSDGKHTLSNEGCNKLSEIFNQQYIPDYDLNMLSNEEKKRLFNALRICAVRAFKDGAFAENFVRDLFETIRDIVHNAPEYTINQEDGLDKKVKAEASGYTQQMSALIEFYYDKEKERNVISSIWINQRGLL